MRPLLLCIGILSGALAFGCQAPPDSEPPDPPAQDPHFLCYETRNFILDTLVVHLEDQFAAVDKMLGFASRICTPVSKNGEGIPDSTLHLVCYQIIEGHDPDVTVQTTDQFGLNTMEVMQAKELCLPSKKRLLPDG